jgi:Exonuclease
VTLESSRAPRLSPVAGIMRAMKGQGPAAAVRVGAVGNPAVLRCHWRDGLPVYRAGRVPTGLVTARQLRALGLSRAGLKPAGWLHYCAYHYLCPLYEAAVARPVRSLTERQRQVLAEGRKLANTVPCKRCGEVRVSAWGSHLCGDCEPIAEAEWLAERERLQRAADEALARSIAADQAAAAKWAAGFLADPSAAVLDTETTGLGDAWMVEVAVVDVTGRVLIDTLVNPQVPIPADATAIHGITDEMIAAAPTFSEILPDLTRVLHGRRTGIYNEEFDCGILRGELDRHFRAAEPGAAPELWLTHPSATGWMANLRTDCAMERYAQWYGEWHDYWENYTWQPLCGGHRAREDCRATLRLLHAMAADIMEDPAS